jgi:hypothetical protein
VSRLVQGSAPSLNREIGDAGELEIETNLGAVRAEVFTPRGEWQNVVASRGSIAWGRLEQLGIYRVFVSDRDSRPRGLAVNVSASATALHRAETPEVDEVLGAGQYELVRAGASLTRKISDSRVGREIFPWMIVFLVLVLAGEYVLSNRFYGMRKPVSSS